MKRMAKGTFLVWVFLGLAIYELSLFVRSENPNKYYLSARYFWHYNTADSASEIQRALKLIAKDGEDFKRSFSVADQNLNRAEKSIDATFIYWTNHPVQLNNKPIYLAYFLRGSKIKDNIITESSSSPTDTKQFDASAYMDMDLYGFKKRTYYLYQVEKDEPGIIKTEQGVDSDLALFTKRPELEQPCSFDRQWTINIGVAPTSSFQIGKVMLLDAKGTTLLVDACQRHVTMLFSDETFLKLEDTGLSQAILKNFEKTFTQDGQFYAAEELTVLSWSVKVFKLLLDPKVEENFTALETFLAPKDQPAYNGFQYARSFEDMTLNQHHREFLKQAMLLLLPLGFLFFGACVQLYVAGFSQLKREAFYPCRLGLAIGHYLGNLKAERVAVRAELDREKAERAAAAEQAEQARLNANEFRQQQKALRKASEEGMALHHEEQVRARLSQLQYLSLSGYEANIEIPRDLIVCLADVLPLIKDIPADFDAAMLDEVEAAVVKVDSAQKALEKFVENLQITKQHMLDKIQQVLDKAARDVALATKIAGEIRDNFLKWQKEISQPHKPRDWKTLVYQFDTTMSAIRHLL